MSATASNDQRPACRLAQGRVTDREGFKACSAALPPIYRKYGGECLALVPAPLVEVAEGAPKHRSAVLARFPSREGKGAFFVTILDGLPGVR